MRSVIAFLFGSTSNNPPRPVYRLPDGTLSETMPTNVTPSAIRDGSISRLVKARDYHSQHADKWNNIADDAALRAREHEAVYSALNETLTRLTNPEWFGNGISGRDDAEHWSTGEYANQIADDLIRELSAPRFNVSAVIGENEPVGAELLDALHEQDADDDNPLLDADEYEIARLKGGNHV